MGDDAVSHRRQYEFNPASTVGQLLAAIRPDASIAGGRATWLVVLGTPGADASTPAEPVGVYAQEWAATRLFGSSEQPLTAFAVGDELTVFFRYLAQVDPQTAFDRYRAGGTLSAAERSQLSQQRIAEVTEAEAKREERASPARYISAQAVDALRTFGAEIEVHSARYLRTSGSSNLVIQAQDTMASVSMNDRHLASFRPIVHAEQFVVVQVGDAWRARTGRSPVSLPEPAPGLGVPAIRAGRSCFVQYSLGGVRHSATFGSREELARRFAGYAPLALSVIIAAYLVV